MKNLLLFIIAGLLLVTAGCKTLQGISCRSKLTVPVTFVTKSGMYYTINVPYCDTISLSSDTPPPATVKLMTVKQ